MRTLCAPGSVLESRGWSRNGFVAPLSGLPVSRQLTAQLGTGCKSLCSATHRRDGCTVGTRVGQKRGLRHPHHPLDRTGRATGACFHGSFMPSIQAHTQNEAFKGLPRARAGWGQTHTHASPSRCWDGDLVVTTTRARVPLLPELPHLGTRWPGTGLQ